MNSRVKTLVILSPGFPKNEEDSACIPPQQVFVKNLRQYYPNLNIIVLAFEYPFFSTQYQWNGITVISFGGRSRGKLFRLYNWIRIRKTLIRLNKQYQLTGLLSFWMGDCGLIGSTFAKRHDLKHFCWILGQDAKTGNKYFKWTNPNGNSLIALSDFIAKETNKNYGVTPAHVIPLGIDPAMFGPSPTERDIDILGAGSLIPLKQFSLLVNMVSVLHIYFPDIKVMICGDGPERQLLNDIIKEHNLEKNIQLTGELDHTSVLALMQRTKVFVHPSAYEGFGMVCLEALYAGAQVVSFVRPMDAPVKNWHFTQGPDGMTDLVKNLLEAGTSPQSPVAPFYMRDTCRKVMGLFDYKEATTS